MKITKGHAADRIFAYAVEALFREHDPIVVHSLFASACNVYGDLNELSGSSWREKIAKDNGLSVKQVVTLFNDSWNFFKHANQNQNATLSFDPLDSEHIALIATLERTTLVGGLTKEMQVFQAWYFKVHKTPVSTELKWSVDQVFPAIELMHRKQQLHYGLQELLKLKT